MDKLIIAQIFDEIITNVRVKCGPTIAEMRGILSQSSYTDQYNQLKEQGLLNPLEDADYNKKKDRLEKLDKYFDEHGTDDLIGGEVFAFKERERLVDELFKYGRRLIEGYETEFPINLGDYKDKAGQTDEQYKYWEWDEYLGENNYTYDITHKMGNIEKKTIENQQKNVYVDDEPEIFMNSDGEADVRVRDERLRSMDNYFAGDMSHINSSISSEKYLNRLNDETRKEIKNIDSLMKDSVGLPYNTLLFRGGTFDIHTRVGESISFKGYTSTSFQFETAKSYKDDFGFGSSNFMYLIHAPKGTKGIVGNDERFTNGFMEHEYVLPRNTKMKVIRIDYDKQVCEVVIEE